MCSGRASEGLGHFVAAPVSLPSAQTINNKAPVSDPLRSLHLSVPFVKKSHLLLKVFSLVSHKSSLWGRQWLGDKSCCFDVRGNQLSPWFIYLVVYMVMMLYWQPPVSPHHPGPGSYMHGCKALKGKTGDYENMQHRWPSCVCTYAVSFILTLWI